MNHILAPDQLSISARLLYQEAEALGIECTIFDEHTLLMQKDGKSWYTRGSRTSTQSSVGKSIADRKELTKVVLSHFGMPTAAFRLLKKPSDIYLLDELIYPVVLKPSQGNQGKGVVVGIRSQADAQEYVQNSAFTEDDLLIAEEMLSGDEFRIICIGYKFFAASQRKPAFVIGDGSKTISQLIDEKNQHPWRGEGHEKPLSKIVVDQLVKNYLQEQGFTIDSIPENQTFAYLRKTANLSTGGEPHDLTDQVCQENREIFEQIARACDLNTIGIDVMCSDLSQPLTGQKNSGIIEVNASPGLRMHHFPVEGTPRNPAQEILRMVAEEKGVSL